LLNALVLQPRIVREASLILEPLFHLLKSAKVELREERESVFGSTSDADYLDCTLSDADYAAALDDLAAEYEERRAAA
jgi:hypothetical protein